MRPGKHCPWGFKRRSGPGSQHDVASLDCAFCGCPYADHTLGKEELDPNKIDEDDEECMTMWGTPLRDEPLLRGCHRQTDRGGRIYTLFCDVYVPCVGC